MKRKFIITGYFSMCVFLFFTLSFAATPSYDQGTDTLLTGVEKKERATPIANIKMLMSGGTKYIPVKNNGSTFEDDSIYNYYSYEQDSLGRVAKKVCYNLGPDKIKSTSDDTIKYYLIYEYDKEGKLVKDFSYNGMGADNIWFNNDDALNYFSIYDYSPEGNKLKVTRYTKDGSVYDYTAFETTPEGLILKDVVFKARGIDNNWFTPDDEIEKYHRYNYDNKGNLLRAMEYHFKQNGKGKDGAWFTPDDEISSTKVFLYNKKGLLSSIKKYIAAGPDKKWFTGDDILQYATMYEYNGKNGIGKN